MLKTTGVRRLFSILLVFTILSGSMIGCSSTPVTAKVDDKLELAIKYLSESNYEEAILTYQEVIKIDPKNVQAYKGMSIAYCLNGKPDEAEEILVVGLKQTENDRLLQLTKAGLLEDNGKKEDAENYYKDLAAADKKYSKYYVSSLIRHEKTEKAIEFLESIGVQENYELLNLLAETYFLNDDKDKALACISQSLSLQPDQSGAYNLALKIYINRSEELIVLSNKLLEQNLDIQSQVLKFIALSKQKKYDDLFKFYEQLADQTKNMVLVKTTIASAWFDQGNIDKGTEILTNIKVDELSDAGILASLGNYYLANGDKQKARLFAERGVSINSEKLDNYLILYKSYLEEDDSLAKIWLMRFLLSNPYGLKEAKSELFKSGIKIFLNEIEQEDISKDIVSDILLDGEEPDDWCAYWMNSVYLDIQNNVAYFNVMTKDEAVTWVIPTANGLVTHTFNNIEKKNYIMRIHNPVVVSSELEMYPYSKQGNGDRYQQAIIQCLKDDSEDSEDSLGVIIGQGGPFEEILAKSGYSLDKFTFIDIGNN
ncbi:hypothetical protein DP73_03825 [Desulfosporosinus sp. HMP52]|nr:hypothetical protein DP73_03825 [Desulfosporosinus sp. HMP52]